MVRMLAVLLAAGIAVAAPSYDGRHGNGNSCDSSDNGKGNNHGYDNGKNWNNYNNGYNKNNGHYNGKGTWNNNGNGHNNGKGNNKHNDYNNGKGSKNGKGNNHGNGWGYGNGNGNGNGKAKSTTSLRPTVTPTVVSKPVSTDFSTGFSTTVNTTFSATFSTTVNPTSSTTANTTFSKTVNATFSTAFTTTASSELSTGISTGFSTTVNTAADVQYTSTASSDVAAAAATAKTESPTSNVEGKVFDRILQIYLETTAYNNTIEDPNCKALIDQGILLTNMYGVGTPSQPNYVAPASGDYFGTNSDSFLLVDRNVSTIVDLLEDKGISWGDYNEGLPYTGFEGFEYSNPVEGNYARKHNLLVRFDSVTLNEDRLAKVKNLTLFYEDLENKRLPQWAFVTPNLYNNGHDTNITVSCNWTRSFVEPLLKNPNFNDGKTLVYITWQANGQYPLERNHVAGILLGSALPADKVGTKDDAYYNHYSELSSVQANWGLHTLGRWDVGANVWDFVGSKTGDKIRTWDEKIAGDSFNNYYWNQSYGGVFSSASNTSHLYVAPNLNILGGGYRTILPAIARLWGGSSLPDYYRDIIELPDALHAPKGYEVPIGLEPPTPITTPIRVYHA